MAATTTTAPSIRVSATRRFGEYMSMLGSLDADGISTFSVVACGSAISRAASIAQIAVESHGYSVAGVELATLTSKAEGRRPATQQTLFLER